MEAIDQIALLGKLQIEIENLRALRGSPGEAKQKELVKVLFKRLFGDDVEVDI